jgi:protein dithiol:quinone oxidoreductase
MWENPAMKLTPRIVYAAIFVACAALIVDAIFYLQDYLGLDPCPMCVLSRYTFTAIGIVSLAAAIHGPRGMALKVYSSLVALLAFVGAGISIRHSYLQHFPPATESCGTDLEFLLNALPLSQAVPKIFAGTGSCSVVKWKLLGLSIPEWALVWFVIFAALALWIGFVRDSKASR